MKTAGVYMWCRPNKSVRLAMQISVAVLIISIVPSAISAQAWYNPAWGHRTRITVDNTGNAGILSNYQVKVALSSGNFDFGMAKTNGEDIRFTTGDGVTPIDFWIESWNSGSQSALIWAEVPSVPGSGTAFVYMYYDNPAASAAGNGDATFSFFDDFSYQSGPPDVYGDWQRVVVATGFDGAHNVLVDDVDGDGRPDLVADAYRAGDVVWYKQPADPIHDAWTRHDIDLNLPNVHDSRIGDMDGDGRKDVVSVSLSENPYDYNQGNGSLVWYQKPVDPTQPWTKVVIASSGSNGLLGSRSLALGDIDSDGDLDVAVAVDADTYQTTGRLLIYLNPGGANALNPALWTEYLIDNTPGCGAGVQIGDIDLDGNPDILYSGFWEGHPKDSTFAYFAPSDPTNISGWVRVPVAPSSYRADLVDFDGDGDLDVIRAGFYSNQEVAWYENLNPSNARNSSNWPEYIIERSASTQKTNRVWAGDIDGDGDLDIGMCSDPSGSTGYFKWYRRPDDPRAVSQYQAYTIDQNGTYTGWAHDCILGDIDKDGDPDMAGVGCNANTVVWWVNEKKANDLLNPNKWNGGNNPSVANGILTINGSSNQYVQTKNTFQYQAFRTSAQFAVYATNGDFGFKSDVQYVGFNDVSYCSWAGGIVQSITAANVQWTWGYSLNEGTGWKSWEGLWKPGEARFVVDGNLRQVHTTTIPTIALPFVVNGYSNPVINVDWVLVRNYSTPEPTATPGTAEAGAIVSLIPVSQTIYAGNSTTLWINLNGQIKDVKGASFKILYDGGYVEPISVVEGPDMPGNHFMDYRVYPDGDSILIDVGILDGHFDGPGNLVGINLHGLAATVSTPITFARSVLRNLDNIDIIHSTQDATIEILADYIRPTVVVNSPASGGYFNTLPTLNLHFNDDIALNRGYYQIDGCTGTWNELWSYNSAANDTVIDWTVPTVTQAFHTIYFRVTDDAGNVNADSCSSSWTFTYDATPPDVPLLLTPADGMYINDNTPYFSWTETAGGGGGGYTLQYSQDPTFSTAVTVSDLTVGNYTPPGPLADGVWHWHVMAEDAAGNPSAYSGNWSFHLDTQIPSPPTAFTVQPGHNRISLSWANASTDYDHTVVMRTDWYSGGHGYPEYDDSHAEGPYPIDTASFTKVYSGTGTSHVDNVAERDVYHYTVFTVDAAGNVSAPSIGARATSYWLGDKTGDGEVYFQDLVFFSNAFWTSSGNAQYDPEFDIGPTDNGSAKGIPTTDNAINFEDLIIFAINFATVNPTVKAVPLLAEDNVSGRLGLSLVKQTGTIPSGQEVTVSVVLENNPGSVKGLHCVVPFDKTRLEFVRVEANPRLTGNSQPVFFDARDRDHQIDLSMAILGEGLTIGGSGEIATITFRVLQPLQSSLEFGLIDIRDGNNVPLAAEEKGLDGEDLVIPREFAVAQNRPNPFNPITEIQYQLPQARYVMLKVYNVRGELVRTLVDGYMETGVHTAVWNSCDESGRKVASGIYLYRIVAGSDTITKKMVLLK